MDRVKVNTLVVCAVLREVDRTGSELELSLTQTKIETVVNLT